MQSLLLLFPFKKNTAVNECKTEETLYGGRAQFISEYFTHIVWGGIHCDPAEAKGVRAEKRESFHFRFKEVKGILCGSAGRRAGRRLPRTGRNACRPSAPLPPHSKKCNVNLTKFCRID